MIQSSKQLKELIDSIANKPFQQIKSLTGYFQFPQYDFTFLKIQGSPGANPASIASVQISISKCMLPEALFNASTHHLALADFLIRRFNQGIDKFSQQNRGQQGSGSFATIKLGQAMLERDSVLFVDKQIELRFIFSLPAKKSGNGLFDAEQAWIMFESELNAIVNYTFFYPDDDAVIKTQLQKHLDIPAKRKIINQYLKQNGYCLFINNGAQLLRQSGINDSPATHVETNTFQSPPEHQVEIPLPEKHCIQGMAIKEGITCITGGGYHGKSTLLQAILAGVYAHIPGDGREYIVTREDAFFIRAEEGRSIHHVNISPFINSLPNGINTAHFCSDNASGSTSQAASIVEAIESGSRLLLFDEDTCATNFLLRDELINQVLTPEKEPIKPLYSAVRSLWRQQGISMIFVVGGLGSFLQKADTCLLMENYHCLDITAKVRTKLGIIIEEENNLSFSSSPRHLSANNFDPAYTNNRLKKKVPQRIKDLRNAPRQLEYGMDLINLEALPQIAEAPQILCIGYCLLALRNAMQDNNNKTQSIEYWLNWLDNKLETQGISFLQAEYPGTISLARKYELAAAINRIRSLHCEIKK